MNLNYRGDIDGLRAVAVLPVVLFHAGVPHIAGGFVGVDIFFVISGYLITSIIYEEINHSRFSSSISTRDEQGGLFQRCPLSFCSHWLVAGSFFFHLNIPRQPRPR